jgi:hypothetical protein
MKIKILKDEYLFNQSGHHICDKDGFATKAEQETECEVDDSIADRVMSLIVEDRAIRGLMPDGSLPVIEEPKVPQELLDAESGSSDAPSDASSDTPES